MQWNSLHPLKMALEIVNNHRIFHDTLSQGTLYLFESFTTDDVVLISIKTYLKQEEIHSQKLRSFKKKQKTKNHVPSDPMY